MAGHHVGFGRPVLVLQQAGRQVLHQRADFRGDAQLLTGRPDHPQGAGVQVQGGGSLGQLLQRDVRQEHALHGVFVEVAQQRGRVASLGFADHVQGRTGRQAGEDFLERHVETQRRVLQGGCHRAAADAVLPGHEIGQPTVGHGHAFGRAGGTRGEQDIGRVVRLDQRDLRQAFQAGRRGGVEHQLWHLARQAIDLGTGDYQLRRGHAEDQFDAAGRIGQIDRQAHRAQGGDGHHRGDLLERPGQRHADHIALGRPGICQACRQRGHFTPQPGVVPLALGTDQRRGLGPPTRHFGYLPGQRNKAIILARQQPLAGFGD